MADFAFPSDPMEICPCLYNTDSYFCRCVGYCTFHKAYLTAKQLKTKNCLGKQCGALIRQTGHPFWIERELQKLDKKLRKQEAASKLSVISKAADLPQKKAEPAGKKKRYICIDLEMNELTSKERKSVMGMAGEVIQIGAVMLDENFNCISQFNSLVKPVFSHIADEITKLTGISDETVAHADTFSTAFYKLYCWAGKDDITAFCWSGSDYKQLWNEIYVKAKNHDEYREFLKTFADLQLAFGKRLDAEKPLSLDAAMKLCRLKFKGQRHNAFADAFNTARILYKMHQSDKSSIENLPKLSAYTETGISRKFEANRTNGKDFTASIASFIAPELLAKFGYSEQKEEKKTEISKKEKTAFQKFLSKKITCCKYGITPSRWLKFSVRMMFAKDFKMTELDGHNATWKPHTNRNRKSAEDNFRSSSLL